MKYVLYGNGSSGNHGCEAIVRGTKALLNGDIIVQSQSVMEDEKYGIDAELFPERTGNKSKLRFLSAYLKLKLFSDYTPLDGIEYLPAIERLRGKSKIALSVGGDNYCYGGESLYAYLNKAYHKNGFKTVLWGCSVEPEVVAKKSVQKDLKRYNLVVARESITYEAIHKVNPNTYIEPDPAFLMQPIECELPKLFSDSKVIGVNASPMIISNEKSEGMAYKNYYELIDYILKNTDYSVALIPHVVWKSNDDREVLTRLYNDFNKDERVTLVDDHNAPMLKFIISKCDMFVGARTHATIAAYSTCVPTLVVGYSVKARGIARDLFGTEDNYVIPVQSLTKPNQLADGFKWLCDNSINIRSKLKNFLPEYKKSIDDVVDSVKALGK